MPVFEFLCSSGHRTDELYRTRDDVPHFVKCCVCGRRARHVVQSSIGMKVLTPDDGHRRWLSSDKYRRQQEQNERIWLRSEAAQNAKEKHFREAAKKLDAFDRANGSRFGQKLTKAKKEKA